MDITPIYDLRARLRASMIAGTNLLTEDFRLRRAVEAAAPLEQASPVFAKIEQLSRALLDESRTDKEGILLDAITLVDAVLCTQGVVDADAGDGQGETGGKPDKIEKLSGNAWGKAVTNAPYSVVSALTEALTSSGSGHFSYVTETHEACPELFSDYRVKAAMVQALGAAYAELAEQVEVWLKEESAALLPLLQSRFDPEGKKEMIRRIRVMETIAPREANRFFVEQLAKAKKEVRQALIFALRHCPENEDLLWDLTKSERGNSKQAAYRALSYMESERTEQYFTEQCGQNPLEVMKILGFVSNSLAARLVAGELTRQLKVFVEADYSLTEEQALLLQTTLQAVVGKTGPEIADAIRETIRLESKFGGDFFKGENSFPNMLGRILHRTLMRTADLETAALVLEIFEEKKRTKLEWEAYFPAASVAHLLLDEDSGSWLSKQLLGLIRPTRLYQSLDWAWQKISWSESRHAFILEDIVCDFDLLDGYYTSYVHTLKQDMAGSIADVLMRCKDKQLDNLLTKYVSRENEAYRMKLEEYYYKRALAADDNRSYLRLLKNLGCKRCEGLAVHYFKGHSGRVSGWEFRSFGDYFLPGDNQAKYQEMRQVYELIAKGKVQLQKGPGSATEDILEYVERLKG